MSTIIFVGNDQELGDLLAQALERDGFDTLHVSDGPGARRCLKDPAISMVIIDSMVGNTAQLIGLMRECRAEIPIGLLATEYAELKTLPDLDADIVFYKPVVPGDFCRRIATTLGHAPRAVVDDDISIELKEIRKEFAKSLPGKIVAIADAVDEAKRDGALLHEAVMLAHRLSGSAGSFGFGAVGEAAGDLDDLLSHGVDHRNVLSTAGYWRDVGTRVEGLKLATQRSLKGGVILRGAPVSGRRAFLIVDDDLDFLRLARTTARGLMLDVVTAQTPEEAISRAMRTEFVGAVLDVHLGHERDPFQLAKDLRSTPLNEGLPLAFISSDLGIETRLAATEAGAVRYFEKPISVEQFGSAVSEFLNTSAHAQGRILIAEDDDDTRNLYARLLKKAGYQVSTIDCAKNIVEELDRTQADLLLLDVHLPRLSGIDVCRALRMSERWSLLPILLITAEVRPQMRVDAFRAGASDVILKPVLPEELEARVSTQLERARLIQDRAERDALTNILTRRAFLENFSRAYSRCRREHQPISIVLIDIDHFKNVNDTKGHLVGDHVLARFGELLRQRYRLEDLRGRWGGEEFILAFPAQERQFATHAANNLLDDFAAIPFHSDAGEPFHVTFTAGIAGYPDDGGSLHSLIRVADERLYSGKESGRCRVVGAESLSGVSEIWDTRD